MNFIESRFYLPHGLTIDDHDQLWVTDVGAHQVFKLTPLTANSSSVQVEKVTIW
jgi:NHL repeat